MIGSKKQYSLPVLLEGQTIILLARSIFSGGLYILCDTKYPALVGRFLMERWQNGNRVYVLYDDQYALYRALGYATNYYAGDMYGEIINMQRVATLLDEVYGILQAKGDAKVDDLRATIEPLLAKIFSAIGVECDDILKKEAFDQVWSLRPLKDSKGRKNVPVFFTKLIAAHARVTVRGISSVTINSVLQKRRSVMQSVVRVSQFHARDVSSYIATAAEQWLKVSAQKRAEYVKVIARRLGTFSEFDFHPFVPFHARLHAHLTRLQTYAAGSPLVSRKCLYIMLSLLQQLEVLATIQRPLYSLHQLLHGAEVKHITRLEQDLSITPAVSAIKSLTTTRKRGNLVARSERRAGDVILKFDKLLSDYTEAMKHRPQQFAHAKLALTDLASMLAKPID